MLIHANEISMNEQQPFCDALEAFITEMVVL